MNKLEMNKTAFVKQLEKAREELWTAHNMATDNNEWHRARFIQNALEDLDALLHIERISK
jgi:hypothetical protein